MSRSLMPVGVEVGSVETACRSTIIIVAVPYPFYHTLPAHMESAGVTPWNNYWSQVT